MRIDLDDAVRPYELPVDPPGSDRAAQAVTSLERSTVEGHDAAASDRELAQIDDGLHGYIDCQQVSELHSQAP